MEMTSNDTLNFGNRTLNLYLNSSVLDIIDYRIIDNEIVLSGYNDISSTTADNIEDLSAMLTSRTMNPYSVSDGGTTPNISDVSEGFVNDFNVLDLPISAWLIATTLLLFSFVTIFGNILVILVVIREPYLHTVTNYFVASLAIADLIVGAVVMPFSVILEVSDGYWPFGRDWCDTWRSVDVLASTASILNLCVISLDRYWAITDSMSYPLKMTNRRSALCIAGVWTCSSIISFPAIVWWRAVEKEPPAKYQCNFTNDPTYLIFSSIISFYFPLLIMSFTYCKIYHAATKQKRSLKVGSKQVQSNGDCQYLTLRIHRGGMLSPKNSANVENGDPQDHDFVPLRSGNWPLKPRNLSRKIGKLGKEYKAAKTLGIVMGVFILCWLPFFVLNVLTGVFGDILSTNGKLVSSVFTWLGWVNSGMNPIIYALWSRDFRRAFTKVLCSACPRSMRRRLTHRIKFRMAMREEVHLPQVRSPREDYVVSMEDLNL